MDRHFVLDRYKWELDRKDRLTAAVNFPMTMLILVSGLLGTILPSLEAAPRAIPVALFVAAVAFGFAALWWFVHAYRGSTYVYLPLLAELQRSREEWREFYEAAHQSGADEAFFEHEFERRIIEAADRNTLTNDTRQAYLDRGNVALVGMFIATALCGAVTHLTR